MRVAITVASLAREYGGPTGNAFRLAESLRMLGHEVDVIGTGTGAQGMGLPSVGRFHGTPIPRSLRPLFKSLRRANVVHILGYRDPVGTAAAFEASRNHIPYVLEPSGMHRRRLRSRSLKTVFDRLIGSRLIRRSARIVATSRMEATELCLDGVPPELIRLRPNGIDLAGEESAPVMRGPLRERLGIPAEARLVLCLGRIAAKKGLVDTVKALERLPSVSVLVAGPDDRDGTLADLLRERDRLGLGHRLIILPDGLWGADRSMALSEADVFCLPSATENFGNAAAEAAAMGVPVVLSDRCGVVEWLEPAATRVVPYASVDHLADALQEVLTNERTRLAAKMAASRIRASLDWKNLARMQAQIYAEVVET